MDDAPLIRAHGHASLASDHTKAGNLSLASDEHIQAADDFARAAKATKDREALKLLSILEQHHRSLAKVIRTTPPKPEASQVAKPASEVIRSNQTVGEADSRDTTSHRRKSKALQQLPPDHGSSIADNLASVRGIPSRREKPSKPTISRQVTQGQDSAQRSSASSRRPSMQPTASTRAASSVEPPLEQVPDAFQTFYSAFGNVISKLSAPLAFAGLPLDSEVTVDASKKETATAETEVDHLFSKPALRAVREDRGHSAADSFYVVPTGGGSIPYSRIASQNNKTREELQLENATLKKLTDDLSKRLHSWEANAQSSSMALAQSIRALSDHGQDERLQKLEDENRKLRKALRQAKPG